MSSTQPEAERTSPSSTIPPQNHIFSPALKRALGTWAPETSPPSLRTQTTSPRFGTLSRTNTTKVAMIDSVNTGPVRLCRFLRM
ncbi:hypothetical protein D3C81_1286650 [compost metagenome]